jgi:hypothetical protein
MMRALIQPSDAHPHERGYSEGKQPGRRRASPVSRFAMDRGEIANLSI